MAAWYGLNTPTWWLRIHRPEAAPTGVCYRCGIPFDDHAAGPEFIEGRWVCEKIMPREHVNLVDPDTEDI